MSTQIDPSVSFHSTEKFSGELIIKVLDGLNYYVWRK